MTARGIVFSGLRASSPNAVAHSKPTRLKIATTTPRPMSFRPWPAAGCHCAGSTTPVFASARNASIRISATEMPSNTSIRIVENVMSLYARNQAARTHTAKSVIEGCDK